MSIDPKMPDLTRWVEDAIRALSAERRALGDVGPGAWEGVLRTQAKANLVDRFGVSAEDATRQLATYERAAEDPVLALTDLVLRQRLLLHLGRRSTDLGRG